MIGRALLVAVLALGAAHGYGQTIAFDEQKAGEGPAGWTCALTGQGKPGVWTVSRDETAPSPSQVLAQADGDTTSYRFPHCVLDSVTARDVDLSVRFKPISGREDQAGGLVWRYRDKDNYYVVRANALESNVVMYKLENGKRSDLDPVGAGPRAYGKKAEVPSGAWSELRVVVRGSLASVSLNGQKLFDVEDRTFTEGGKVGIWTKADSVTHFDDFTVAAKVASLLGEDEAYLWESRHTSTVPEIDGSIDPVWETAKPLLVTVREAFGGNNPVTVELRALHTDVALYVLARWPDATKSDMRDPYVWSSATNAYERPSRPDDQFALEFPMSGEFDISMLTTEHEYEADVWHWKAGRGNAVGWVDDKRHIISQTPVPKARSYELGGHGTVYVARLMDGGTASYRLIEPPKVRGEDVVDSFRQGQPSDSLADVRGKGTHDGDAWTLEMSRRFDTGHDDDTVIDPSKEMVCAIAVLNDELYWRHSVSPRIRLRFR